MERDHASPSLSCLCTRAARTAAPKERRALPGTRGARATRRAAYTEGELS